MRLRLRSAARTFSRSPSLCKRDAPLGAAELARLGPRELKVRAARLSAVDDSTRPVEGAASGPPSRSLPPSAVVRPSPSPKCVPVVFASTVSSNVTLKALGRRLRAARPRRRIPPGDVSPSEEDEDDTERSCGMGMPSPGDEPPAPFASPSRWAGRYPIDRSIASG